MLRAWLVDNALTAPSDLIFRTRNGTRPTASNWGRGWHRALRSIGHEPLRLRVYDCRHAAARPGFAPAYLWARLHAAWVTASTPSCRPTLARSMVTSRSPTAGSTRRWAGHRHRNRDERRGL